MNKMIQNLITPIPNVRRTIKAFRKVTCYKSESTIKDYYWGIKTNFTLGSDHYNLGVMALKTNPKLVSNSTAYDYTSFQSFNHFTPMWGSGPNINKPEFTSAKSPCLSVVKVCTSVFKASVCKADVE
jgi:hypothetical protein